VHNTTFDQAYPYAKRAAEIWSRMATRGRAKAAADREDLQQEAIFRVWYALPRFDPARASLRTFVEHVVANQIVAILRPAKSRTKLHPLDNTKVNATAASMDWVRVKIDVDRVVARLNGRDRLLAILLMEFTPSEIVGLMGISRSTFYERVSRLRREFESAGLGYYGSQLRYRPHTGNNRGCR
jgi:RNA polymerase sigma factor (sigma-70 family)